MKLHTKLLLGFGGVWAVLLLSTVLVLLSLRQQSASLEDAFHSNFDSVDYCNQMTDALDQMNLAAMTSVWTKTPPSRDAIAASLERFQRGKQGQLHNITLPREDEITHAALDLSQQYLDALNAFLIAPPADASSAYQNILQPKYLAARQAVRAVNDLNFTHLRTMNASLQSNLSNARSVQILFALVGAGFALAGIVVLANAILVPLRALTQSARQVEAGNLDQAVPIRSKDELGELAAAFNAMAAKLREYRQLDSARLQRTQQTTQLAIDSLPDAVAVLNPGGLVEISNTQARIHFGMTPEKSDSDAFPAWLRELIAGPLTTGSPVESQGYQSAVQLFDNGVERFFLPRAVPMRAQSGEIIGVVVTLVDITRLHRADEIKRGLVATISHELKTPLAAARFCVHLLADESVGTLDEKQRRLVRTAREGADRLHRIIEDLLEFQRFEEGRQVIRGEPIDPAALVQSAVDPLREDFAQRGLHLHVLLPDNLPKVIADQSLITHVLTNLLSNALKYVPKGGQVQVTAEPAHIPDHPPGAPAIHASAAPGINIVRFTVADDGPGIPSEHHPKIFTRFYRAAAPLGTQGAGLGLAIARQLVEANGGKISLQPSTKGAHFTFYLRTRPEPT